MIMNIFLLINVGSAFSPADYKAGVDMGHLAVDIITKLSEHLQKQSNEVRDEIYKQRKYIETTAEVNIDAFTESIARASSALESAVMDGDSILQTVLRSTEQQLKILNTEFKGVRFHDIIIKAAKRELLSSLTQGVDGLTPLLVKIDQIKHDMNAISEQSKNLQNKINSKWTPEAVKKKIRDWRLGYLADIICPGAILVHAPILEVEITKWKADLAQAQTVVTAIKNQFDAIEKSSNELATLAGTARQKYTDAIKEIKISKATIVSQGFTEGEVDTLGEVVTCEEVEWNWTTTVIPGLEILKQRLIELLK